MSRLEYVCEGIDTEENGRLKSVNVKYFGEVYDGTGEIERFWEEVYEYIESAYDVDKIKRINLNGDGAA